MSVNISYTKGGPGRKHQHCLLRYIPQLDRYVKAEPRQRLKPSFGPDSINAKAVFRQKLNADDLAGAKLFLDDMKTYKTDEPWMHAAIRYRLADQIIREPS